ncbi:MAG: hypothetical protein A2Y10_12930 [Planctomycetes bacterium GWF2_41_51]|nr:MAG: hypothetical protein A2Y10_12930 [Planctomycetes bacterium GWF2_41_51]HBG28223.1 hypothetical protein [Phycisphaerales bacterium]
MNKVKKEKGFTLVELLVVISIIALLLAVLMPALSKAREQGKLILCGTNQKQLVTGVLAYAAANYGRLPPSIQGLQNPTDPTKISWGKPSCISNHKGQRDELNGGSLGGHLKSYLKDAKLFQCALSGIATQERIFNYNKDTYQELYESGQGIGGVGILWSSYMFMWNYRGYPSDSPQNPYWFECASSTSSRSTLLVFDGVQYSKTNGPKNWFSPHPFKGASRTKELTYLQQGLGYTMYQDFGNNNNNFVPPQKGAMLNGGFLDGHVEKYQFQDLQYFLHQGAESEQGRCFLPIQVCKKVTKKDIDW